MNSRVIPARARSRGTPASRAAAIPATDRLSVAFIVDHPARDLAGLVLTAAELCHRGVECHLVPLNLMRDQLWTLAPDMVVLNYARPSNEAVAREMLGAGIRVGVLDTEGAAWEDCSAYSELLWGDRALLRKLSFFCMWGPVLARHLIDEGLLVEGQLAVTGCPRFDFYHPRWRAVFDGKRVTARPMLLINTNFSYGNPRFASVARNREHLQHELGLDGRRVAAYLEAERAAMQAMIDLAGTLAGDFPGCDVVLRPHPFEDPTPYATALAGSGNLTVDGTGSIQSRLLAAAAVIQRSCSTAAEAAMAGVPTLSPQWVPAPALIPFAEAVSTPCETYAELRSQVEAVLAHRSESQLDVEARRSKLTDWFFRYDGCAYQRVADTIQKSLPRSRTVEPDRCVAHLYRLGDPRASVAQQLGARMRFAFRLSPAWSFRHRQIASGDSWRRSEKHFSTDDVLGILVRVRAAMAIEGHDAGTCSVMPGRTDNPHGAPIRSHSVTMRAAP